MSEERQACQELYISKEITQSRCQAAWDDLYCWPPAEPDELVSIPCAEVLGTAYAESLRRLSTVALAYRKCGSDGSWAWNDWTNYSECLAMLSNLEAEAFQDREITDIGQLLGHLVLVCSFCSLASLVTAIGIFVSLRSIACIRIRVHTNLCIALVIHCLALIVISSQVVLHPNASAVSPLYVRYEELCKVMKTVGIYSSMATINWMFVEGLVLHKSLYSFANGSKKIPFFVYHIVGWVLPIVFVGTWIALQELVPVKSSGADGESRPHCWQGYGRSNYIWIVTGPMLVALIANIGFLINIIRVLVIKLHKASSVATPRAIRATAFLIPLLGLEHLIFCINPSSLEPRLESAYIIVNGVIQSVQGLAVSFLFCFLNKEVRRALRASWTRRRLSSFSSVKSRLTTTTVTCNHRDLTNVHSHDSNISRSLLAAHTKNKLLRVNSV